MDIQPKANAKLSSEWYEEAVAAGVVRVEKAVAKIKHPKTEEKSEYKPACIAAS